MGSMALVSLNNVATGRVRGCSFEGVDSTSYIILVLMLPESWLLEPVLGNS